MSRFCHSSAKGVVLFGEVCVVMVKNLKFTIMKKALIIIAALYCSLGLSAKVKPIEQRPQDVITYSYELRSNHSVSMPLGGIEYSYEGRVADRWSLIGRVGLVPIGFAASSVPNYSELQLRSGLGLTFEARWYSNIAKRAECGRSTYNNSSDFVSMRLRANTGDGLEVSFTPAYGIRRSFGRLWFHEVTFGPKIGITTDYGLFLAPHIQYRIGLAF